MVAVSRTTSSPLPASAALLALFDSFLETKTYSFCTLFEAHSPGATQMLVNWADLNGLRHEVINYTTTTSALAFTVTRVRFACGAILEVQS